MELSITQPDDWHLHLRDGDLLQAVIPHRSFNFRYKRRLVKLHANSYFLFFRIPRKARTQLYYNSAFHCVICIPVILK